MENMADCEICPTALSEEMQQSRWDIRSCVYEPDSTI